MIGEALDEQIRGTIAPHGSGALHGRTPTSGEPTPNGSRPASEQSRNSSHYRDSRIYTKKTMVDGGTFVRGQDHRMLGARSNHAGSRVRRDLRQPTRSHARSAGNGNPTRIGSPGNGTNTLAAGGETDSAPEQPLRGALQLPLSPDKVAGPRCQAPEPLRGTSLMNGGTSRWWRGEQRLPDAVRAPAPVQHLAGRRAEARRSCRGELGRRRAGLDPMAPPDRRLCIYFSHLQVRC